MVGKPASGSVELEPVDSRQFRLVVTHFAGEILAFGEPSCVLLAEEWGCSFSQLRRRKNSLDGVVVAGGDGVKFVVVAPRAAERMGQESLADAVSDVVEKALPGDLRDFHPGQLPRAHPQKTSRDDALWIIGIEFIPGDLLPHESVKGFVFVKSPDDIVTISPGIATLVVVGETSRVGIANHIEPVLGHPLTIVRAREEPLDNRCASGLIAPGVVHKCLNFGGSRWQPGQVEAQSPQEGSAVCRCRDR